MIPSPKKIKRALYRSWRLLNHPTIKVEVTSEPTMPGALVASLPRSGSTLLRMILDSHSQIACPPELQLFKPLMALLDQDRLMHAMDLAGFDFTTTAETLGRCGQTFVEAYARSKNKSLWVEKTPGNWQVLDKLALAMPSVRFIVLHRHPFHIVRSMMARDYAAWNPAVMAYAQPDGPFAACCRYVADGCTKLLAIERSLPHRCISIRYETFTQQPAIEIERICQFLAVDYEPSMLDFTRFPHDTGLGDEKINATSHIRPASENPPDLSIEEQKTALRILGPALDALGYPVACSSAA